MAYTVAGSRGARAQSTGPTIEMGSGPIRGGRLRPWRDSTALEDFRLNFVGRPSEAGLWRPR